MARWIDRLTVPGAVAVLYLGEPPFDLHGLAVRAGVMSQHVSTLANTSGAGSNSEPQDIGAPAFADFDDGAGVVGDQPAQHGVGVLGVAQVPGAVELVQAGGSQAGGVADVVQLRGGFEQISVRAPSFNRLAVRVS